ncbi:MAG TPA: hypothetical protein VE733_26830 [Streptosporangiaceae bacterium]|nr:hypothetical protein [Streptosporangiaceae bacterium]
MTAAGIIAEVATHASPANPSPSTWHAVVSDLARPGRRVGDDNTREHTGRAHVGSGHAAVPSGLVLLEAVLPTMDLPDVLRAIARRSRPPTIPPHVDPNDKACPIALQTS